MVVLAMVDPSGFDINIIKWIVLFMYTPVPILERAFGPSFPDLVICQWRCTLGMTRVDFGLATHGQEIG